MFDNMPVDKIGLKDTRLSNLEYLGGDMIEAGNEFGPSTPYGEIMVLKVSVNGGLCFVSPQVLLSFGLAKLSKAWERQSGITSGMATRH